MQESQDNRKGREGRHTSPSRPSRATYLWAAALAAIAGFATLYVSAALYVRSGTDGNALSGGGTAEPAAVVKPKTRARVALPTPAAPGSLHGLNRGAMAAFLVHKSPRPVPEIGFADGDGKARRLADWSGKVVLLNLWATWCAPCRREMPTLDRLKTALGGAAFDVVAVSIDRSGLDKPRLFLKKLGISGLALYNDKTGRAASLLKAFGIPTTLLIDRQGREIGRLTGPAEWDSPEARALVSAAIGAGG